MENRYSFFQRTTFVFWGVWLFTLPFGISQCINTFPYFQDFEANDGGWVSSSITPNGTGPDSWTWDSPINPVIDMAYSGLNCWITGNDTISGLPPYSYQPGEFSAVVSPCFDFTSLQNPGIMMAVWWESELGVDGTVLQASTDNGTSWITIGDYLDPVNWYNGDNITGSFFGGPGGQLQGWTGIDANNTGSGEWVIAQHLLNGLAGEPSVFLRFAFAANTVIDTTSLFDGFAFDDILIADVPTIDIGSDTVICFADILTLDACIPGVTSYQWNNNPIDTFCTKLAISSGTFTVRVIDTLGFVIRDTLKLTVSNTFVNLGSDIGLCPGDTAFLDAGNPWGDHLWLPDSINSQTIALSSSGSYTVLVSDSIGCVDVDSINIIVDFVPDTDLGPDTTICAGDNLILDASAGNPGTTYDWEPISATSQTVSVSSPGVYSVIVTSPFGCLTGDTIAVNVLPVPAVDLGPDTLVCLPITLNAQNPGATYSWSTGESMGTIEAENGGVYSVVVTASNGCQISDTIDITAGIYPDVDLGADQVICGGDSILLGPGGTGVSYLWSTLDTTSTLYVSFPDLFFLDITSADGCTARDSIIVNESSLNLELGPNVILCEGESVVLNAGTTGDLYNWSTNETTQTITVSNAGTYSVQVLDSVGCALEDTVSVIVNTLPDPQFSVLGVLELFETLTFSGSSNGSPETWIWEFGDGITSTLQNPTHTYQSIGTFDVCLTVIDDGCEATLCQEVTIDIFQDLDETLNGDLNIYPNPSGGIFTIDMQLNDFAGNIQASLFDLTGREIWTSGEASGLSWKERVRLDDYQPGLHILALEIDGDKIYRKVLFE